MSNFTKEEMDIIANPNLKTYADFTNELAKIQEPEEPDNDRRFSYDPWSVYGSSSNEFGYMSLVTVDSIDNRKNRKNYTRDELQNDIRALFLNNEDFAKVFNDFAGQKGMRTSDVYNKAEMTRSTFSKIYSGGYHASRYQIFSLAAALTLTPNETERLLNSAGLSSLPSSIEDRIILCCFNRGIHDLPTINSWLKDKEQRTLGKSRNS